MLIAQSETTGTVSELFFIGLFFLLVYMIMNEFSMVSMESIQQYFHVAKVLPLSNIVIMKNAKNLIEVTLPSQPATPIKEKSPKKMSREQKKLHSTTKVAPWKAASISNLFHNLADTRGISESSIQGVDSPVRLETIYAKETPSHFSHRNIVSSSKPPADPIRTASISQIMTTIENPLKAKKVVAPKTIEVKSNSVLPDLRKISTNNLDLQQSKHVSGSSISAGAAAKRSTSSTHRPHPIKRLTSNNRASSIISQESVLLDVALPRKSPLPTARRNITMQRPSISFSKKQRSSSTVAAVTKEEEVDTGEMINCLYNTQPPYAGDSDDSSDNGVMNRNASVVPIGLSNVVGGVLVQEEQKAIFTMLRRVHRNSLSSDRPTICIDPNSKIITPNRIRRSGPGTNFMASVQKINY